MTDNANRRNAGMERARPSLDRSPRLGPASSHVAWALRVLVIVLCLVGLPLHTGLAAPVSQDTVLTITYPSPGSALSGQVPIQGTATHPGFVSYGLLYATGTEVTGATSWQHNNPIAWDVRTMVVNGVLGTWDTTQVPNGQYVLAIAMYKAGDETPSVYFVNNLTVRNEEATPTPEPTATPTEEAPGEAGPTEEAGPPPAAATIVLPPTATPRPTATLAPDAAAVGDDEEDDEGGGLLPANLFSLDAVKEAFVLGAQIALLLYAIGVLYVLAKAVIRYYLRQSKRKPSA